ncbi:DNA helicase [Tanacetum coccineum]
MLAFSLLFYLLFTSSTLAGLLASRPSKRAYCNVFQRTLPAESSPSKRRRPSTARVTNTHMPEFNNVNGQYSGSSLCALLCDYDQRCHHCGATFWFGERLKGSLCSLPGEPPRFLQLYIYDTKHELENMMRHFGRTTYDRCQEIDIIKFNIRLYNGDGARGYELPASNTLGAIVFYIELTSSTEFDMVIEHRGGLPKRIGKLYKSYMSLKFPLLFIYRQSGFHTELKLRQADGSENKRRVTMLAYYAYQLHTQCGLPHCHTLVWVDSASKIQEPEDVDRLISAELPDPQTNPQGYKVVSGMMIHGPCGAANMSSTCMQGDKPLGESSNAAGSSQPPIDEIQNYLEGHFVCPQEAIWRILKFDIHYREPAVQMLYVHLEDMQKINFRDRDRLEYVVNLPGRKSTTLIEWLAYNASNEDGRHLTYLDFPSEFVWYDDRKSWSLRQNSKSFVGHVAYVHPTSAACEALGLIKDDNEWDIAMQEACASATSSHLRFVFAHILTHCEVTDPLNIWTKLLMEDRNYNERELQQQKAKSVPKLNTAQRKIYDLIINAIATNQQELIYVYGHGGTGKTFIWKTIIIALCSEKNVLAVAPSGIASLLLPSGRTTHSRFKLPIELTEESLCKISKNSHLGKLLVDIDLIIWDEAPMNDRRGDFRQTLPVKKGASKIEVIASCISKSELWMQFRVFTQKENVSLKILSQTRKLDHSTRKLRSLLKYTL